MSSPQLERLRRRMNAIPQAVRDAVTPALIKSGEELVARQQALVPVRTGALRDSIEMTPPGGTTPPYSQPGGSTTAGPNQVLVTAGNEDVRYPHLVEYGVAHAPAQPFFWPAYRLTKKRIANRIKRSIGRAVREGWIK
ncbi:HK97-gp10 family putative phage morphogenesis protein [Pinisolibacter sp.]|uniref:HK97-gp10 family putative phage morphogenesis protein n=1 Tax=Pinisolibacter sp. TaxID=2172024 RepID=UPI002FDDEADF